MVGNLQLSKNGRFETEKVSFDTTNLSQKIFMNNEVSENMNALLRYFILYWSGWSDEMICKSTYRAIPADLLFYLLFFYVCIANNTYSIWPCNSITGCSSLIGK